MAHDAEHDIRTIAGLQGHLQKAHRYSAREAKMRSHSRNREFHNQSHNGVYGSNHRGVKKYHTGE